MKDPFNPKPAPFNEMPLHKSAGILDDYAVRKDVQTREATIGRLNEVRHTKSFVDIQAAVDSLPATGGTVFVDAGTYEITATIILPDNVSLVGEGKSTIISNQTANSGAIDSVEAGDSCVIRNIYFLGNITDTITNYSGDNINLNGSYNIVDGCWFHGGERCVRINLGGCTYNKVVNCYGEAKKEHGVLCSNDADHNIIKGNHFKDGTRGVYLLDADHNIVEGNMLEDNTARNIFVNRGSKYNIINGNFCLNSTFIGISVENDTSATGEGPSEYNVVSNNVVKSAGSSGISVTSDAVAGICHQNSVIGNSIYDPAGDGINVGEYAYGTIVNGNNVYSPGSVASGIDNNGDYSMISGNLVESAGHEGIKLDTSSDFSNVSGNTILNCGGVGAADGIRADSTFNMISGNLILNAGRHGIFVNKEGNTITGNIVNESYSRGIEVEDIRCVVTGNTITNSGQGGDTEAIRSIQVGTVVTGNSCWDNQATKTQTYGYAEAGSGDYAIIVGNNFRTNKTGSTNALGANSILGDNIV